MTGPDPFDPAAAGSGDPEQERLDDELFDAGLPVEEMSAAELAAAEASFAAEPGAEPPRPTASAELSEAIPGAEGAGPGSPVSVVPVVPGPTTVVDDAAGRRRLRIPGIRGSIALAIRALLVANVGLIAVVLLLVMASRPETPGHPAQASPGASVELMPMGLAHIPTSNSCLLCHETGGSAGLKPIPAIGHPLEGWRRCLSCHTNEALGRKAPGHAGIPESECLNCHKLPPEGPTITQPHSRLQNQHCLDCHGSYAHLPSSMVGRNEDECWLCHKPTELPPPEYPHALDPAVGCRECHQSPQVGGLPIDHALREDTTCLLCHDIKTFGSSTEPALPSLPPPGG